MNIKFLLKVPFLFNTDQNCKNIWLGAIKLLLTIQLIEIEKNDNPLISLHLSNFNKIKLLILYPLP